MLTNPERGGKNDAAAGASHPRQQAEGAGPSAQGPMSSDEDDDVHPKRCFYLSLGFLGSA